MNQITDDLSIQKKKQHQIKKVSNFIFDIYDQIGSGFSSKVYKGKNCSSGQLSAIKVIQLKKISNGIEKLLIQNQVKALNTMKHPNLLKSIHVMQTQNNLYLVTELFQQNVEQLLKKKVKFNQQEVIYFLLKMAQAICYLQTKGIIHRDIKLSNIFVANADYVLGDFGFCYFLDTPFPQTGYNVGSPLYMSPQAYKVSMYSHESDIWALGICAIELVLGLKPFTSLSYDQMVNQICNQKFYKQLEISEFLKDIFNSMFIISSQKRIAPNQLLEKLKNVRGIEKKNTNVNKTNSEATICINKQQKDTNINYEGNHRRCVSVRINQDIKQVINFKNNQKHKVNGVLLQKKQHCRPQVMSTNKCVPSVSNSPSLKNLIALQYINEHEIQNDCPPQMMVLKQLGKTLLQDSSLLHLSPSLLKLLRVICVLPNFEMPSLFQSQLWSLPPDPYYNHVIKTINVSSIFQISHYLLYLIECSLSQLIPTSQIPEYKTKYNKSPIKILQHALSLWSYHQKKQKASQLNILQNCKHADQI